MSGFTASTLSLAVAASLMAAAPAMAAIDCTQDRAVYADSEGRTTVSFKVTPDNVPAMTSNEFTIAVQDADIRMDGVVMWLSGVPRPGGIVMYQCPDGDVTGEELEACTIWQGVIYALQQGANAGFLPKAKEPAAEALLFPDFADYVTAFDFRKDKPLGTFPFEVFRFRECTE